LRQVNAYLKNPYPTRRPGALATALAIVLATLLAIPAVGIAGSGGGGIGPSGNKQTQRANGTVSSTAGGMTITTHASGFDGRTMNFVGSTGHRDAGKKVVIERSSTRTGGRWIKTTTARVASNGSFDATWNADKAGPFAIRAVLHRSRRPRAASGWPTVNVILYKMSVATIYGPGFWGNSTACGRKLRHKTLGVANRTLPCGTKVSIYYGGRSIVVPVIDRGPYANGANWDLTEATAKALHMPGTETVGSARLS
jgi:rare lipoprotein A